MINRCAWAAGNELMQTYHDEEWGIPVHNDQTLFEFLILEGAQAGLSWQTVLNKREHYRSVYDNFDPAIIARYTEEKQQRLLADPGIVRNRLKVAAAIKNAKAFLDIQKEFGSFDSYIWKYVDGEPIVNACNTMKDIAAKTDISDKISKDLKKRGMNFVGSTIMYAFMQAVGMVNDHTTDCFRYKQV